MTSAQHITRALNGRWHGHYATCFYLVHADAGTQSLSVMDGDVERLLAYRHSDCDDRALLDALGTLKLSKRALSGFLILTPKTGAVSRPKLQVKQLALPVIARRPGFLSDSVVGKLQTKAQGKPAETPLFQGPASSAEQATPIVCKKSFSAGPTTPALEPADPDTAGPLGHGDPATSASAKPKARQHPRETREQRRVKNDRRSNFMQAVAFAFARDWQINVAITVGWVVLIHAGALNEGHCLGLAESGRDERLRAELCRLRPVTADKAPFVALWTRAIGGRVGHHIHLGLFWPTGVDSLDKLVALLERLTGSPAAPTDTLRDPNVIAQSVCKGWQIKRIYGSTQLIGALNWCEYMLQHADKHLEVPQGKTFGLSQAIGPKARAAFRPSG